MACHIQKEPFESIQDGQIRQRQAIQKLVHVIMGLGARNPVFGDADNKGADQSAHPRRLISAFVIRYLERNIFKLATDEVSIF